MASRKIAIRSIWRCFSPCRVSNVCLRATDCLPASQIQRGVAATAKNTVLLAALLLLLPATARAELITFGTWTSVAATGLASDGRTFWDGNSWDGERMNVGFLVGADLNPAMEFLHSGYGDPTAFRFDDLAIPTTLMAQNTLWDNETFGFTNGIFTYDSGTGRRSNSWETPGQYALFRWIEPEVTHYYMGIEDILLTESLNDRDYNDYIVSFDVPRSVPEPSSMSLILLGLLAARLVRRSQN
jgi:hypothetical protein